MNQQNAILLVSFGTSYLESKAITIDKLMEDVTKKYKCFRIYQAWTSGMIINILKERENLVIPTIEEAMAQICLDGIQKLVVQPTHLINGLEHERMKEIVLSCAPDSLTISFGTPLLTSLSDHFCVLKAVMNEYSNIYAPDVLVFMGHGTTHYSNSIYAALDYELKDLGYFHAHMGTVESYPCFDTLQKQVKISHTQTVHLAPFMLTAGDHANEDMAGNSETSWKSRFEAAGYQVICHMHGLGEFESIRSIYLDHLKHAVFQLH